MISDQAKKEIEELEELEAEEQMENKDSRIRVTENYWDIRDSLFKEFRKDAYMEVNDVLLLDIAAACLTVALELNLLNKKFKRDNAPCE